MLPAQIRSDPDPDKDFLLFLQYIDKPHQRSFLPKTIIVLFMLWIHEADLPGFHFLIVRKII